ncbi:hypothetical protein [Anatilimnocola floriformis]|uniref:hypothetical protein n=1 Tax=Anatilimnocola floriformis TaxID=2948575 RepID=UPI0020C2BFA5|nr:hypothetical protein [Anatilimnocola floriformis]
MKLCDLLELGLVTATQAPVFIECRAALPHGAIEQYWSASKCRQDRWYRLFRQARGTHTAEEMSTVIHEVLASELLTRVFLSMCSGHDRLNGNIELEPIAHSIFVGHLEARNHALQWMVGGSGADLATAVDCNRFRRRVERWTDLLLGRLAHYTDPAALAFDPDRALDFAQDFATSRTTNEFAWNLASASARVSFQTLAQPTYHVEQNRDVASAVLGCFGDQVFDGFGLSRSLWLERMSRTASDTQGMIEQLIRLDAGLPIADALQLRGTQSRRLQ